MDTHNSIMDIHNTTCTIMNTLNSIMEIHNTLIMDTHIYNSIRNMLWITDPQLSYGSISVH